MTASTQEIIDDASAGQEVFVSRDTPELTPEQSRTFQYILDATTERFRRYTPWFAHHYPEATPTGSITSALDDASAVRDALNTELSTLPGKLFFKRDDKLPVSGSVKARGGFHEVLEFVDTTAKNLGLDISEPLEFTATTQFHQAVAQRTILVGSTGNLGLSIGILSRKFGFNVEVHMSADAKAWKKELLRAHGAEVVEHQDSFVTAVAAARVKAESDPRLYFVDDEYSPSLFAGYMVGAAELIRQLETHHITVDPQHPLYVYLPCGVGGAPGGITAGLKLLFGTNVKCIFIEPTQMPAMMLGTLTGKGHKVNVSDYGLGELTVADGLAVPAPSAYVYEMVGHLIDGFATISDEHILASQHYLAHHFDDFVEPSAASSLTIPWCISSHTGHNENATHVLWFTGGAMTPDGERTTMLSEAAHYRGKLK